MVKNKWIQEKNPYIVSRRRDPFFIYNKTVLQPRMSKNALILYGMGQFVVAIVPFD